MVVDLDKLGELIDGYGGISADDLSALPQNVVNRQHEHDEEVTFLRAENAKFRSALAEVELILTGLRGSIIGIIYNGDEREAGVAV